MSNEPIAHFEAASTLAVVVSSNEPLLFLSEDQKVIAASTSFCRTFEIDPATIPGRPLSELGNGRETRLPDYVILIATVGGLSLFGLSGFVLGPLVAALFIAVWSLFTEDRLHPLDDKSTRAD